MENLMEVVLVASLMDALLDFPYQKLIWKLNLTEEVTTGTPISVFVPNTDQRAHDYSEMSTTYRPSHADATCDMKYGARAVQGCGRSSARETIGRVAAGVVAKKILKTLAGTEVSRWLWPRFIPQSSYSPVKGLHLFGGVGTRKTMFMDLFFDQFDQQNIGYKNIDARGLITGFQFLQAYYPERLAKCFILHMPRFFVSVWRMVSRFLEKATLEKIVIVTNEDERQDFIKEVGEEVLPEEYGGRAKLVAIQDVVLAPLEG